MAVISLFAAHMATDHESLVLKELGELAGWCRRFADSDCSDTEAFVAVIRRADALTRNIPPACGPLSTLVYWVGMLFKTRPTDLDREGVRAIAATLASVRSLWIGYDEVERIRHKWREAGVDVKPF
ncbi:MAG: hypothetical protein N3D11_00075 [Candidatus Sumerlaeia bacterium]|nr:hypothetical protein [Candidatus Sumerlaeia bacterium]